MTGKFMTRVRFISTLFIAIAVSGTFVTAEADNLSVSENAETQINLSTTNYLDSSLTEAEQVNVLVKNSSFKPMKNKDPFEQIIKKQLPIMQPPAITPKHKAAEIAIPPVKPIQIFVSGIVGNDSERLALVKFENELHILEQGNMVKGKFRVMEILRDRVVVFSEKEQMRRTFPMEEAKN